MKLKRVAKIEDLTNSLLLANHSKNGDICIVEETAETFEFQDGKWIPYISSLSGKGPEISLYELNRSIMRTEPNYNSEQIQNFIKDINNYHNKQKNVYYMMLSVENSYYTVFVNNPEDDSKIKGLGSAILAISLAIGPIIGHEICENHVEIWLRHEKDDEAYIYMLFPYDGGVVSFD